MKEKLDNMQGVFDSVHALISQFIAEKSVPSLVFCVVDGNGTILDSFTGGKSELPLSATSSLFRIASQTKSFTAAAVLRLRDMGKLRLDDEASVYVPQLQSLARPKDAAPLTVRRLLSMASGFATDDPWGDRLLDISPAAFDELLLSHVVRYANAPGTAHDYSNLNYAILGRIITNVSGRPFGEFITETFLRPLGMMNTVWEPIPWEQSGSVVMRPHALINNGVCTELEPLKHGEFAAMGGLWTTAQDLGKWVSFFLSAFPPRDLEPDEGPLSRASRREMQQTCNALPIPGIRRAVPQAAGTVGAPIELRLGYGFGLVQHYNIVGNFRSVGHSGGLPGFGSNMRWLPDHQIGVISFGNVTYCPCYDLNARILDILVPKLPPFVRPVTADLQACCTALLDIFNTGWTPEKVEKWLAFNVALDLSFQNRAIELAKFGTHFQMQGIVANSDIEGFMTVLNEVGKKLRVHVLMAPTKKPLIQSYEIAFLPENNTPSK